MQISADSALPEKSPRTSPRLLARIALVSLLLGSAGFFIGCGLLIGPGGEDRGAVTFSTGELRVTEDQPLAEVSEACRRAIETLGYREVETQRDEGEERWRATTPGGDPVDIHLRGRGPKQTEVGIRVGVSGNEGRSRLVLEQIRQSLRPIP